MASSRRFTAMSPWPAAITGFQFGDICLVLIECIEISEDHVAFDRPGIARTDVVRVCVHPMHGLPDRFGFGGQQDGIALRLAHFGFAVDARPATNTRDQSFSFREYIAADLMVDTPHDLVGLLDERCLVLANRNDGPLEGGDVGRLGNRVTQKPRRDISAEAARGFRP